MEVPGRLEDGSSTNTTNRNVIVGDDLVCQPCDKDGIRIKADGFCVDCEEHLCQRCIQTHTKPAPCRHHVLLDRDAMPKVQQKVVPKAYDELDLCGKHRDERLKFWCTDHNLVACSVCITLQHRLCKVDYIPDLAQTVTKSEEYSQLCQEMKSLKERSQASMKIAEKASFQIESDYVEILNEIKKYRKEINEYLDGIEQEVLEKAKIHTEHEKKLLQKISRDSEMMLNEIVEYELKFQQLESAYKFNSLFTEIKSAKDKVNTMIEKESITKTDAKRVEFLRSSVLSDVLNKTPKLGTLVEKGNSSSPKPGQAVFRLYDEVTIKSKQKCINTNVQKIVEVSDAVLALQAEYFSIGLYDVKKKTIIAEQRFSDWIDDIVGVSQGKLAILLSSKKLIRVLSTSGCKLSEEESIKIQEEYSSIVYCLNGLIVTVDSYPGRVLLIDLNGNVMQEIVKTESLYRPDCSEVGVDNEHFYVSDNKHSITKMTFHGEIVAIFREDGYFGFRGMQELHDGTLIVCCEGNDTLLRISSNFTRLEIRGIENVKFWNLQAICYSKSCQKLYVVCASQEDGEIDTIKVFDVKS